MALILQVAMIEELLGYLQPHVRWRRENCMADLSMLQSLLCYKECSIDMMGFKNISFGGPWDGFGGEGYRVVYCAFCTMGLVQVERGMKLR